MGNSPFSMFVFVSIKKRETAADILEQTVKVWFSKLRILSGSSSGPAPANASRKEVEHGSSVWEPANRMAPLRPLTETIWEMN